MTYRMGPTSPRAAAARKLGPLLTRLLDERHVSKRGLAAHIGVKRTTLQWWCSGDALPRLEAAAQLAEALADDRILAIVKEARIGTCPCGATFEYDPGNRRRYCSRRCRTVEQKVRDGVLPLRSTIARHLEEYRDAIDAFCRACEPEGLCRTSECALRGVSPLPLVQVDDVAIAAPWSQGKADPVAKAATTRAAWARLTPQQRAARVRRTAEARWPGEVAS